ncbi:MAG: aldehyde dehydrogenase [Alphaproteobacteria bacterium]|nr:aldehyde dehydrogenase [Alphaproteobacteria bacterium]
MNEERFHRRALVADVLAGADDRLLVVAGLGQSAWDVTAAGDRPLNLPLWGAMGGTLALGLGLALARPERRVLVITGDGDMLMGLGSLATVAVQRPRNLAILVLDNERFGETGNQATHTAPVQAPQEERGAGTDLALMARGAGIADSDTVRGPKGTARLRQDLLQGEGPVFRVAKVLVERLPLVLPPRDGAHLKERFRLALLGEP